MGIRCHNTILDKAKLHSAAIVNETSSLVVKSHNPWGGMTNYRLKRGVNSKADAEIDLKYLDGTAYTHIPGLILGFNDRDGPNPFRIIENNNGELLLSDAPSSKSYDVLCQYDCQPGTKK